MGTENPDAVIARMEALNKKLDEYEQQVGLLAYNPNEDHSDAKKYLNMEQRNMEAMSLEECAEASLLLGSLSFHIQRAANREKTVIGWAERLLKEKVSGRENQYRGSWESQFYQAISEDDFLMKVSKVRNYAQSRYDRLTYLSTSIMKISELFTNLQKAKVMK